MIKITLELYKTKELLSSSAFAHANDLEPKLVEKIKQCIFSFKFPKSMIESFEGLNQYISINYKKDWKIIREIYSKN